MEQKFRIGISLSGFNTDGDLLLVLEKHGYEVINPAIKLRSAYDIAQMFSECEVIIAGTEPLHELVSNSKHLKLILRAGIGTDNIPIDICLQRNIKWVTCESEIVDSVANYVLSQVLNISMGIYQNMINLNNSWRNSMGKGIQNTSIGIIGFGRIGGSVGLKLSHFKFQDIGAYDVSQIGFLVSKENLKIRQVDLDECLANFNILTLHVPLNHSTKNLISYDQFKKMNSDTWIINTSRGEVINEEALIQALENKMIAGAILDVFATEPYKGKLTDLPNAILTPHIATFNLSTRTEVERNLVNIAVDFINS